MDSYDWYWCCILADLMFLHNILYNFCYAYFFKTRLALLLEAWLAFSIELLEPFWYVSWFTELRSSTVI